LSPVLPRASVDSRLAARGKKGPFRKAKTFPDGIRGNDSIENRERELGTASFTWGGTDTLEKRKKYHRVSGIPFLANSKQNNLVGQMLQFIQKKKRKPTTRGPRLQKRPKERLRPGQPFENRDGKKKGFPQERAQAGKRFRFYREDL